MNYIDMNNGMAVGLIIAYGITKVESLILLAGIFGLVTILLKLCEKKGV